MRALNLDRLRAAPATSPVIIGFAAGIVLAQLAALAGALLAAPWIWAVGSLVGIVLDVVGHRVPRIRGMFGNAQIGLVARALVRELSLLVLVARAEGGDVLLMALTASIPLARGAVLFLTTPQKLLLQPSMRVRNLRFPLAERRWWPVATPAGLIIPTAAVVPTALVGLLDGPWWPFVVTVGALTAALVAWALWIGVATVRRLGQPVSADVAAQAGEALNRQRPELVLYFSGTPESVYQVNMWLPVVESIGRPAVVLLRSDLSFEALGPTTLPVLSIPSALHVMNFRMPTVRASFVVAHVGNNIHMLREPRIKHVFIGHGESDKAASVNPITKGFDEVWVAGPASRRRWHQAKVGVRDDAIVEVGRPQLSAVLPAQPRHTDRPLSVLYAPTWEGWIADAANASSVADLGVAIVEWLVARPDTRLIYKPHPLTGTVSGSARRADLEMVRLLRTSGAVTDLPAASGPEAWRAADNHIVVGSAGPSLYDCFNNADVLIGDISSVVPDFLASEKPYLIPNPHGMDHDALRAELASTRAAYIMNPDPGTWEALLTTATGIDPMAQARRELRLDILGPRYEDPVEPWRQALTRLISQANSQWPDAIVEAQQLPE